eukprot:5840899-Prymnesium_polylepis.2
MAIEHVVQVRPRHFRILGNHAQARGDGLVDRLGRVREAAAALHPHEPLRVRRIVRAHARQGLHAAPGSAVGEDADRLEQQVHCELRGRRARLQRRRCVALVSKVAHGSLLACVAAVMNAQTAGALPIPGL